MKFIGTLSSVAALALTAGLAWQVEAARAPKVPAPDAIFEINLTNDLNISSGEPQIAVDPLWPLNIVAIEMAAGSSDLPAWSRNPVLSGGGDAKPGVSPNRHMGRVQLSKDGGNTWTWIRSPAYDPFQAIKPGGGDPMVTIGPDGTIYVATETGAPPPKGGKRVLGSLDTLRDVKIFLSASMDGGKTWTFPQQAETPRDRPWMKADESTGTVYTASTGPFNPKTKVYNVSGPDAPMDRWLTAWKPHLTGHSEPRRLGGPDFSAAGGSTLTAANGVVASTFLLGPSGPFGGNSGPQPIPASLKNAVTRGTKECSSRAPCIFFQTSSDEGQTWKRHQVPFPAGAGGFFVHVAADGGHPGRYAVGAVGSDGASLQVMVTDDSGESWTGPHVIPETAKGADFKQWMDYSPNGVLGYIWKKQRDDVSTPMTGRAGGLGQTWGAAFDVYAAISCDGGRTWERPVRINAETSPSGPNGFDDLSYVALDSNNLHAVWGDRRNIKKVKNIGDGIGGIQAYYGRVPFAAVTKEQCGRDRAP